MLQVCSVYSQLLQLFSRGEFARAVKHHQAERNAKGFSSWEQFVAMLFCRLAHLNSLREVCMGLASCESPLKHLGISTTPKKSTLAYANANRPWELYESIFMQLLEKCQLETAAHSRRKFRFKNKLMSLDGSIIELSATMFDWAKYTQQKGAIKLHLLLDHDGYCDRRKESSLSRTHYATAWGCRDRNPVPVRRSFGLETRIQRHNVRDLCPHHNPQDSLPSNLA